MSGITTSEALDQLAPALAAAQAQIRHAIEDSQNPHFRSRYASLTACWDACRGPLSQNGLSVVQGLAFDGGAVVCSSRLLHISGQWMEASLSLPVSAKITPQSIGSAATYAKRFSLSALVGITTGDDDDGGQADGGETDWKNADRKKFMADMGRLGWKYAELCAFLEWIKRDRPSRLMPEGRAALLQWMTSDSGTSKIAAWMRSKETP